MDDILLMKMLNRVSFSPEMQMLEFKVFNICNGTQPIRGQLPVTPGSYLTWFGFRDEGQICSFDSKVCSSWPRH